MLREKIATKLYGGRIAPDEVFVSDGAKCDIARLQLMFGQGVVTAAQDPSYPVYVDTAVIMGQTGTIDEVGFVGGLPACLPACLPAWLVCLWGWLGLGVGVIGAGVLWWNDTTQCINQSINQSLNQSTARPPSLGSPFPSASPSPSASAGLATV